MSGPLPCGPAQAQQQAEEHSRQLAHANHELSAARVDSAQTAELLELLSDEQRASAQRLQELEQLLEDEIQDKVPTLRPARMHRRQTRLPCAQDYVQSCLTAERAERKALEETAERVSAVGPTRLVLRC